MFGSTVGSSARSKSVTSPMLVFVPERPSRKDTTSSIGARQSSLWSRSKNEVRLKSRSPGGGAGAGVPLEQTRRLFLLRGDRDAAPCSSRTSQLNQNAFEPGGHFSSQRSAATLTFGRGKLGVLFPGGVGAAVDAASFRQRLVASTQALPCWKAVVNSLHDTTSSPLWSTSKTMSCVRG